MDGTLAFVCSLLFYLCVDNVCLHLIPDTETLADVCPLLNLTRLFFPQILRSETSHNGIPRLHFHHVSVTGVLKERGTPLIEAQELRVLGIMVVNYWSYNANVI